MSLRAGRISSLPAAKMAWRSEVDGRPATRSGRDLEAVGRKGWRRSVQKTPQFGVSKEPALCAELS